MGRRQKENAAVFIVRALKWGEERTRVSENSGVISVPNEGTSIHKGEIVLRYRRGGVGRHPALMIFL